MKLEKCPECEKGCLQKKKIPYYLYGIKIGDFEGEVCSKCDAKYFNEEQDMKIEEKVKSMNLWGLETESKIRQSGSSLSITLPSKLVKFLNVKKGKEVMLIPEDEHTIRVRV